MKKIYLTLSLAFASLAGFSQLMIHDANTGMMAQPSYTLSLAADNSTNSMDFEIHNHYSTDVTVKVKRYLVSYTSGHDIYYCFGANCYSADASPVFNPVQSSLVTANGMLPNGQGTFGLKADFEDLGVVGTSKVMYVLYDVNNVNDSIALEITYNVSAVGLSKLDSKNFTVSNPMPNPASSAVTLKYEFNSIPKSSSIKVYNMVGLMVKEIKVEGTEGKAQFDVSGLSDGVYFYSLVVNNKAVSTKRLIVSK